MKDETQFRWPSDGRAYHALLDTLDRMERETITDDLLSRLTGRACVVVWLAMHGQDATTVLERLHLTETQLTGMLAQILDTLADTGETVIMPLEMEL